MNITLKTSNIQAAIYVRESDVTNPTVLTYVDITTRLVNYDRKTDTYTYKYTQMIPCNPDDWNITE